MFLVSVTLETNTHFVFSLVQCSSSFSSPFRTCSFPLLLSCIFQPLLFTAGPGVGGGGEGGGRERGMFAYSLTRRVWHLTEQICFNVNHTGGNYGLFAGRCRAEMRFWPRVLRPYEPPLYLQLLHFFHMCRLRVVTDASMVLITAYSCCSVSNSRRLCRERTRKATRSSTALPLVA